MAQDVLAAIVLIIWLYLIAARGGFWRANERDYSAPATFADSPAVTAVVPARDEAETVGETVNSLLRQEYQGALNVVLVDEPCRTARQPRDCHRQIV